MGDDDGDDDDDNDEPVVLHVRIIVDDMLDAWLDPRGGFVPPQPVGGAGVAGQGGEPCEGCLGTTRNRVVVIDFAIYFQKYPSFVTQEFF